MLDGELDSLAGDVRLVVGANRGRIGLELVAEAALVNTEGGRDHLDLAGFAHHALN